MIIKADPQNPRHVSDIKRGAAHFAEHIGRPDIMPDVRSEEGRNNLEAAVDGMINLPSVTIFLAYQDDECVGGTGVLITPYIFDYTRTAADELFWWADASAHPRVGLKLLRTLHKFIKDEKCDLCVFHRMTNSPKPLQKIYERMGLSHLQTSFAGGVA